MSGPTIDIAGAARATGLSVKALRGRVERGSLPATLIDGRRRIPIAALLEAGLLVSDASQGRAVPPPGGTAEPELVARLDAQAEEIARLRAEVAELRSLVALRTPAGR